MNKLRPSSILACRSGEPSRGHLIRLGWNSLLAGSFFLLAFLSPMPTQAQDDPPPQAPYVVNAPKYASWVVSYKTKTAAKSKQDAAVDMVAAQTPVRELKKLTVVKADKVRQMISTWSDGTTSEQWIIPGYQLEEQPGRKDIYMSTASSISHSNMTVEDYSKSDFPEFAWLSEKNYSRVDSRNEIKCWKFEGGATFQADTQSPAMAQVMLGMNSGGKKPADAAAASNPEFTKAAWVSVADKLPLAYDDGIRVATYEYRQPPTEPPVLPERFRKVVGEYEKSQSDLAQKYRMPR